MVKRKFYCTGCEMECSCKVIHNWESNIQPKECLMDKNKNAIWFLEYNE